MGKKVVRDDIPSAWNPFWGLLFSLQISLRRRGGEAAGKCAEWHVRPSKKTRRKLIGDLSAEEQMHKHLTAVHLQLHEWKPHIPVGLPVGSKPRIFSSNLQGLPGFVWSRPLTD